MRRILGLLLLALPAAIAQPTIHIFEVDNVSQTGRVVTMGMVFKQGDIANCAVPVIGGTPLTTSNYQVDVKSRWPDSSLQRAVISFITNLTALQNLAVSFQSGACNNSGQLTQSQMVHFNSDGWGAQMVATVGGVSKTVDAVTMLNALADATYCQIEYDLQGPIVTKVRVQDCTSAFAYDFGASWGAPIATVTVVDNGGSGCTSGNSVSVLNDTGLGQTITPNYSGGVISSYTVSAGGHGFIGTGSIAVSKGLCARTPTATYTVGANVMTLNSGAWYTYATSPGLSSLHPMFDLTFVPSTNAVQVEFDLQNMWSNRGQDQKLDSLVLKTGAAHTTVWDSSTSLYPSGYVMPARTHIWKTFWSGTPPGHVRIDWNFPYLISTGLLANYDLTSAVTSVVPAGVASGPYGTGYSLYASGDHGDVGGTGGLNLDFVSAYEMAMQQIEPLRYLYSMGTASTLTAAKAWAVLTGEVDTQAGLLGVSGGGGLWHVFEGIQYHMRESRPSNAEGGYTANGYYCANYADRDATPGTTTAGSCPDAYLGRGFSKHAWINDITGVGVYPGTGGQVGSIGVSPWSLGGAAGDCAHMIEYSFLPAVLLGNRLFLDDLNRIADSCVSRSDTFLPRTQAGESSMRSFAIHMQMSGYAAFANPDGTPEKSYYTGVVNTGIRQMEGFLGITGTNLTPSVHTCSGYSLGHANSWVEGRCSVYTGYGIDHQLHFLSIGSCPIGGDALAWLDPTKATDTAEEYFQYLVENILGQLNRMGFTQVQLVLNEALKRTLGITQDPAYNPFLLTAESQGTANGGAACTQTNSGNPQFTTWAQVKGAYLGSINPTSMGSCDEHDWGLLARGGMTHGLALSDGSYTGTAAYSWINANFPWYFSGACTGAYNDQQLPFAILPAAGPFGGYMSGTGRLSGTGR